MKNPSRLFPVTVIVAMRNSATTVLKTLDSVANQSYPVTEVIVVDNASSDNSVALVQGYKKSADTFRLRIVKQAENQGVGASYNLGVKMARTKYVVFMHSDSTLPTKRELNKLTAPMRKIPSVVATYSYVTLPFSVWEKFPFWEKCLLANSVGKEIAGMNGKFDCIEKRVFVRIGGFDDLHYGHDIFIGGEDGDLHVRLKEVGRVACSKARVTHLHSLDPGYGFMDWIANRKLLARSYGRFIRIQWRLLDAHAILFLVKPSIVVISVVIPFFYSIVFLLLFSIYSMKTLYIHPISRQDKRLVLLPFVTMFLIYYESFWMIESFLFLHKK